VNDARPHQINLNISGKNLQLQIDDSAPQTVTNYGRINQFRLNSKKNLYLGGLSDEVASKALSRFHIKDGKSLNGCISSVQLNGKPVDLDKNAVNKRDIQVGCIGIVDLCSNVECKNEGTCLVNSTLVDGFRCQERRSEIVILVNCMF
jgi:hypothetical protein